MNASIMLKISCRFDINAILSSYYKFLLTLQRFAEQIIVGKWGQPSDDSLGWLIEEEQFADLPASFDLQDLENKLPGFLSEIRRRIGFWD